jgi:hypothetical protein
MNQIQTGIHVSKGLKVMRRTLLTFASICFVLAPSLIPAQSQTDSGGNTAQATFSTPEAAVEALVQAASSYDVPALISLFGPSAKDFLSSADPVRDKNNITAFAAKASAKNSLHRDPKKPGVATLTVGEDDFPFPVPLVQKAGKWHFDSAKGHSEILVRRIGANELDAIQVCHGYVEAQRDYAATTHDDSGVNQYAQKIISTEGKQDGLFWKNADGTPGGPVSEAVAKALAEGYTFDKPTAYHGYYFKILKGQGPAGPLGKLDYVVQGAMIGGFALVAVPAEYRVTGVKTFIVGPEGTVYEKDLGPNTLQMAKQMDLYNPDKTWAPTDDSWSSDTEKGAATAAN